MKWFYPDNYLVFFHQVLFYLYNLTIMGFNPSQITECSSNAPITVSAVHLCPCVFRVFLNIHKSPGNFSVLGPSSPPGIV